MNNFSPSTDTSVGTKRFTAQEVQLAYTLMAVEYMKTIKGLNPNHQLVDKAVKHLKRISMLTTVETVHLYGMLLVCKLHFVLYTLIP